MVRSKTFRNMGSKKGYVRTLEVVIAIVLTLIFLMFLVPRVSPDDRQSVKAGVLAALEQNQDFRDCALARNVSCVESMAEDVLPERYSLKVNISSDPEEQPGIDVQGDIYSDSLFIAGSDTSYNATIVRLWYWLNQ
ncbi:hypothetical protein GF351_03230 [Candidatus Woesearchaeota archaeon]|nr:hypothetical protein [Candidatus Woesearchaeota archaeon]